MKIYKNVELGRKCIVQDNVFLGLPSREHSTTPEEKWPKTRIGCASILRSGTIIYCDVTIGKKFQSGHNVLVREKSVIGDNVLLGTNTVIEGYTKVGTDVNIQSSAYIPMNTVIEDKVFIGPNAVLTNDKYPIRRKEELKGPILRKGASIGANCTILPNIEIGEGAIVAAGSVVTKNVPAGKLAVGVPAKIKDLPKELKVINRIGD